MPVASVKVHTPTDSPKAQRRPWRCERESCPSPEHHDSLRGYRRGCKSGASRRANAAYQSEKRAGRASTYVPGLGVARRLQALHALGWSDPQIAKRLGAHDRWVASRRVGVPRVLSITHDNVADLYLELSETDPPPGRYAERSRREAARAGEQPPEAWDPDDGSIDDPDAEPYAWRDGPRRVPTAREERRAARNARIRALHAARLEVEKIAVQVGVSSRTVWRVIAQDEEEENAA